MMYGIEFQTIIKDGVIEVPPEYRERLAAKVRVILLSEEEARTSELQEERPFGLARNEFRVPDDFDAPLPDHVLREFES
ncbi:MAG: hypothetical protein N2204_02480 [Anaerolineae bacterium]|nr:hypothetical protein [Anaerolineae bacterium]